MTGFTLRGRTIAAFVLPAAPVAALTLPLVVYVQPFYISVLGLDQSVIAAIMFVVRIFDVLIDPFLGWLGDTTRTRWGRRRPWIVAALPPFVAGVFMLFVPPTSATPTYFAVWIILSYLGYSMVMISHYAWGAELSTAYHERSRVQGWMQFSSLAGYLLVLLIPALMERVWPSSTPADRLAAMGWFITIGMPVTVAILLAGTPEPRIESTHTRKLEITVAIRLLLTNGPLRRIIAADLMAGLAPGITGALFIWMVSYYLELPNYASSLLFVYFGVGLLFIPFWVRLSYRMNKHRALCLAAAYPVCLSWMLLILPKGNPGLTFAAFIILGIPYGASAFLFRSMMADVVDTDTLATGGERSGLFFSLLVLTSKLGLAISSLCLIVLAWVGFSGAPGAHNSPEAIQHMAYVFVGFPVLFLVIMIAIMWNFPIDRFKQQEIREAIARKREAAAQEIAATPIG